MTRDLDRWDAEEDLEPLLQLSCELLGEQRPVDARLVMRAWRELTPDRGDSGNGNGSGHGGGGSGAAAPPTD